jgi:protein-S-isoprenylcysteine O-methyltransferase Ste14
VRWQIEPMVKENSPETKSLRPVSFVVHATRGVIRNQTMRRKTMFAVLVIALVLLFSGSTFLASMLNPQEHPMRFVLFWFICAWLTLTTILLAVFDLLMVRLEARKAQRGLQEKFSQTKTPDSPRSTIDE